MSSGRHLRPLLLCALSLLIAAPAIAQTPRPTANPLPPPVDRSGSIQARKNLATAKTDVDKAQAALTEVVNKLRADFENGDEWKEAAAAQKEAQTQHDALRKPIVEAVKKTPAYLKAETDKRKAEEEIANYRLSGTSGDPVIAAANKRVAAVTEMNRIEDQALDANPKFVEWKKKLDEANAQVNALKRKFDTSLATDMAYMEARKAVDTAKEQHVQAQKSLTQALASEAEAEKARREAIRQSRQY